MSIVFCFEDQENFEGTGMEPGIITSYLKDANRGRMTDIYEESDYDMLQNLIGPEDAESVYTLPAGETYETMRPKLLTAGLIEKEMWVH